MNDAPACPGGRNSPKESHARSLPVPLLAGFLGGVIGACAVLIAGTFRRSEPVAIWTPRVPPADAATCIIAVDYPEHARLLLNLPLSPTADAAAVSGGMLRHDRVIAAMKDSPQAREIDAKAAGDADARSRLEREMYRSILKRVVFEPLGGAVVHVTCSGRDRPDNIDLLRRLANTFLEETLAQERTDAKAARDLASAELRTVMAELETRESALTAFREMHPQLSPTGESVNRQTLLQCVNELEDVERQVALKRRRIETITERLEKSKDLAAATRETLAAKKDELTDEVDCLREVSRSLRLRKTRLEEEAQTLPAIETEYRRLVRARDDATRRYDAAQADFRRLDRLYAMRLAGLCSVHIISPP